ncbi:short-chain dehydrogenase [Rhodococcus sp. 14-2496-1d]|uniref:alpha/beta fold hydrolase n=1 Tax=Rhodococcus sp. 14-2496-1d TaxID=2023146 RepID=UPI000B9B5058|nr:alpha/beta fold hydrolase [Rhodococcus sp. 14-2496-1d]OZF25661.1 short-chain dehydrogenase [Rhodococcus sp. 14-2496-1d]
MTWYVEASDGTSLAVQERGNPDAPTILCVHGFPDDHSVWDGVARELVASFNVVTFDVRGSGLSDAPARVADYRLDQLADDIVAVADAVSPHRPVHLLAHDWGSVQAWHLATEPRHRHRVASLTSISGPSLDHIPAWISERLRRGPNGWKDIAQQWKSPFYMGFFQMPWLAPLACRLGIVDRVIAFAARWESGSAPVSTSRHRSRDNRNGLKIYTANLLPRILFPENRFSDVPAQVLVPRGDIFITPSIQMDIHRCTSAGEVHFIDGGHWAPSFHPAVVATATLSFVNDHSTPQVASTNNVNGATDGSQD